MRLSFLCFIIVFSFYIAIGQSNEKVSEKSPQLRKVHEEHRDEAGKVNCYVDSVFRGNLKVMATYKGLTKSKYGIQMVRAYFANGKDVTDEIYYDDGTREIRLYQDDVLCEVFRLHGDASVEPVGSEELEKFKMRQQDLMRALKQ